MRRLAIAALASALLCAFSAGDWKGFVIGEDGTLLLEGKPFRGIGGNFVPGTLFSGGEAVPLPEPAFAQAAASGLPFLRVMFNGYHPVDVPVTAAERTAMMAKLDRLVNAAEANNIGLIVSFAYNPCSVPDRLGEPVGSWTNSTSATRNYYRQYVTDVVQRFANRRGIYGWEFGNELNLFVDVPGGAYTFWPTHTSLGYPAARVPADEITNTTLRDCVAEAAALFGANDPYHRITSSGNSLPRPSAWNLRAGLGWGVDTYAQFKEMFDFQSPGTDVLSGHFYTDTPGSPYFDDLPRIAWAKQASLELGRPLVAFEWGVSGDSVATQNLFAQYVAAIEANEVVLSSLWVFNYPLQPEWTVTPTNARAYQLTALAAANARMRALTPRFTANLSAPPSGVVLPSQIDVDVRNPGQVVRRLKMRTDVASLLWEGRLPSKSAYDVSFKLPRFLRKTVSINASGGDVNLGPTSLYFGDLNGDNLVDLRDYNFVRASIGSVPGKRTWNPAADLNGDLAVNTLDLMMIKPNLGRAGDN